MTKADMINAEYWDRLWEIMGERGGIRSVVSGNGDTLIFDPPINRDSYAIPLDFPYRRSDGGKVQAYGVHPGHILRPGASGEPTGAFPEAPADRWVSPVGSSSREARERRMENPEFRKAWIERFGEDYGEPALAPPPPEPETSALFGKGLRKESGESPD